MTYFYNLLVVSHLSIVSGGCRLFYVITGGNHFHNKIGPLKHILHAYLKLNEIAAHWLTSMQVAVV